MPVNRQNEVVTENFQRKTKCMTEFEKFNFRPLLKSISTPNDI